MQEFFSLPLPQLPPFEYDLHTVEYSYDAISRLLNADYHPGLNVNAAPFREHAYGYDLAGNLVDMDGVTRTFNAANQMTNDGTNTLTYDDNGNLTNDGTNAYTWDRANRLLTAPGSHSYAYDGDGRRIQKTVSSTVTDYLLDVQPGLSVVLAATTGASTDRYVHGPRGIHTQEDNAGVWTYPMQDGLGSVRQEASATPAVNGMQSFDLYGNLYGQQGTINIPFAFTGEIRDGNHLQDHRARHLSPALGAWLSLDPFEGTMQRPMSLNGYSWVEGNTPNMVDPHGHCPENPWWNDILGQRCVYLVNRFCDIHGCSKGGRQALMRLEWWDLEKLTLAETVDYWGGFGRWVGERATIIPNLFLENPLAALKAVQEFFSCGDSNLALGDVFIPGLRPGGGGFSPGGLIRIGLAGLTGYLLWLALQEYSRSEPQVEDIPQDRAETKRRKVFNLAFGIDDHLWSFVAALKLSEEIEALPWIDWPDFMVSDGKGGTLRLASQDVFKAFFDAIMTTYLTEIPGGKFKFNLGGMDNQFPESLTTWELKKISSTPSYDSITDYYMHVTGQLAPITPLSPSEAKAKIRAIIQR